MYGDAAGSGGLHRVSLQFADFTPSYVDGDNGESEMFPDRYGDGFGFGDGDGDGRGSSGLVTASHLVFACPDPRELVGAIINATVRAQYETNTRRAA
jgi:hypothetical protein